MPETEELDPQEQAPEETKPAGRFYSEEDYKAAIEKARAQERDKLYPQLSKSDERTKAMQDELKELRAFQKKQEKSEADRLAAVDKAKKEAEEAELTAKQMIDKRQEEWNSQFQSFQSQAQQEQALLKKELEFMQLQNHIQRRVSEESDSIAPELMDFITGNTVEEVEASIERVKEKTSQLVESMKAAQTRQRAQMPGVSPSAGTNATGPMDQPGDRQLSDEDIAGMDMGQFAELRKKLGMDRLQSGNTGIFGM